MRVRYEPQNPLPFRLAFASVDEGQRFLTDIWTSTWPAMDGVDKQGRAILQNTILRGLLELTEDAYVALHSRFSDDGFIEWADQMPVPDSLEGHPDFVAPEATDGA